MFGLDFGHIHINLLVAAGTNESFAGKYPEVFFDPIPGILLIVAKIPGLLAYFGYFYLARNRKLSIVILYITDIVRHLRPLNWQNLNFVLAHG